MMTEDDRHCRERGAARRDVCVDNQCVSVIFDAPLLRNFIMLRGSDCVTECVASSTYTSTRTAMSIRYAIALDARLVTSGTVNV